LACCHGKHSDTWTNDARVSPPILVSRSPGCVRGLRLVRLRLRSESREDLSSRSDGGPISSRFGPVVPTSTTLTVRSLLPFPFPF
jgi:hypothetical protein